jgi:dTDP-4-dehydrorhamnose reductase
MARIGSILLTGASGLLGSNFALTAAARGLEVTALYRSHPVHFPGIPSSRLDLTSEQDVCRVVNALHPDWIVHCAAVTDVDWCEDHPEACGDMNAVATRNLAGAASEVGAAMLYVSTDSVYPGISGDYREDDPPGPVNRYARTKLMGEETVRDIVHRHLIIRTSIFGWNTQKKQSIAEWFLYHLERTEPVPGFSDVIFSPVLVNDLAEIFLDLMASRATGTYNAGSPDHCSKFQFGICVAHTFGLDPTLIRPIRLAEKGLNAPRPYNTSLNSGKMLRILKRPIPDLPAQLSRFRLLRDSGYVAQLHSCSEGK